MQAIPPNTNTSSTSSVLALASQSNPTLGEQPFNNVNTALSKQQLVMSGPVAVPSALTSVYCKLHKYAFEGKKTKLKKILKDNKGKFYLNLKELFVDDIDVRRFNEIKRRKISKATH